MLDLNLIRERPEWVKEQIARLNDTAPIDEILALDEERRASSRKSNSCGSSATKPRRRSGAGWAA
jgi:seryl-tRNA synthetase